MCLFMRKLMIMRCNERCKRQKTQQIPSHHWTVGKRFKMDLNIKYIALKSSCNSIFGIMLFRNPTYSINLLILAWK